MKFSYPSTFVIPCSIFDIKIFCNRFDIISALNPYTVRNTRLHKNIFENVKMYLFFEDTPHHVRR